MIAIVEQKKKTRNKRPKGHEGQLNTIRDSVQSKEPAIPYRHYKIQVNTIVKQER